MTFRLVALMTLLLSQPLWASANGAFDPEEGVPMSPVNTPVTPSRPNPEGEVLHKTKGQLAWESFSKSVVKLIVDPLE